MVHASHSHRWHESSQPSPQPCTSMAAPTTSSGTTCSSGATASPWGILGGAATSWAPVAARANRTRRVRSCTSVEQGTVGDTATKKKTCQQRALRLLRSRPSVIDSHDAVAPCGQCCWWLHAAPRRGLVPWSRSSVSVWFRLPKTALARCSRTVAAAGTCAPAVLSSVVIHDRRGAQGSAEGTEP